jgi:hypothetical protein
VKRSATGNMCEFEYSICDDGTLTSPRGHIAYCARRGQFVMDNAIDGFDMFQLDGGVKLLRKFITKTVDVRTPKQVVFCEEGKALVGGSDHGLVYVFDRRSGEGIDEIPHADGGMVQTVSVCQFCPLRSAR